MSIVSIAETESYLGVASGTDTTLLTSLIEYSQALIEEYTDNKFSSTEVEGEVLEFGYSRFDQAPENLIDAGEGLLVAYTRYSPISDVVVYDGDEILTADTDYKLNLKTGKIQFYSAVSDYADNLTVDYTYGYSEANVPKALKMIALEIVSRLYKNHGAKKGDKSVKSKSVGDFSVTYDDMKSVNISEYSSILNRYRVVNI